MGCPGAVKRFLLVLASAAAGFVLAPSAGPSAASLNRSTDGQKAYQVRLLRGPYEMDNIKGVVPLHDATGCYIVWNDERVDVYRVGWSDEQTYDCAPIWTQTFRDVQGVVPIGDGSTCFVVYSENLHYVFKADWYGNE